MRFPRILLITFLNILQKKWNYLKMILGFIFCFLFIVILCLYSGSLSNTYDSYKNHFMYSNFIRIEGDTLNDEQVKEIKAYFQVRSIFSYCPVIFISDSIKIDENEYDNIRLGGKIPLIALLDEKSDCTIQSNIKISFVEDYNQNTILYGRDIINKDEVLINEQLLEDFGIRERESLIGKKLIIDNEYVTAERTICGIVNKNLLEGTKNNSYNSRFHLTMYNLDSDNNEASNKPIKYYHCIDLKDFSDNKAIIEKVEIMLGVKCLDFRSDYVLENVKTLEAQQEMCDKFLSVISVGFTAIVILYIIINQFFVLQQNRTFYGLLQSYGLNTKQLFIISSLEILLISLIAGAISLLGGVGLFFVLKQVFNATVFIELQFNVKSLMLAIFSIVALGIIMAILIALFMTLKFFKKSPIYLLKNK